MEVFRDTEMKTITDAHIRETKMKEIILDGGSERKWNSAPTESEITITWQKHFSHDPALISQNTQTH